MLLFSNKISHDFFIGFKLLSGLFTSRWKLHFGAVINILLYVFNLTLIDTSFVFCMLLSIFIADIFRPSIFFIVSFGFFTLQICCLWTVPFHGSWHLPPLYSLSLTSGSLPNLVSWCHTASVWNVFVSGGAGCTWMWWDFYKLKPSCLWGSWKISFYWASFFLSSASSVSSSLECRCHVHQGSGRHLYCEQEDKSSQWSSITDRQQILSGAALTATMCLSVPTHKVLLGGWGRGEIDIWLGF